MPKCPECGTDVDDPQIYALYECDNIDCGHAFEEDYNPEELSAFDVGEAMKSIRPDLDNYDKLKELVLEAYLTENSGTKMNNLVCRMRQITHPDFWKDQPSGESKTNGDCDKI